MKKKVLKRVRVMIGASMLIGVWIGFVASALVVFTNGPISVRELVAGVVILTVASLILTAVMWVAAELITHDL